MPHDDDSLREQFRELQREFSDKHAQNRRDIEKIEGKLDVVTNAQSNMERRLAPYIGTEHTDGLLDKMAKSMEAMGENVRILLAARHEQMGAFKASERYKVWFRWIIGTILAALSTYEIFFRHK